MRARTRTGILGIALGALCLVAAAPAAVAQQGPPGGGQGMHGPGGPGGAGGRDGARDGARALMEFLELTDEQREAWIEAHRAHGEALRPSFEKMRELREQVREELDGGSPDATTVGGYVIAIHELEGELEASRGELEATISEILTDEQETRLEAWKAANPDRRRGPPGPGFGGPGSGGPPPGGSGQGRPGGGSSG